MLQPTAKRLKDLEAFLDDPRHDIGTMTLSEFDGFIAGIVVCPDLIMPSEWLPEIWGDGPEFADEAEAQRVFGQIMEHYNGVIHALDRPGAYAPIFAKDTDGTVLWELWASGFGRAMDLREEAWHVFAEHGDGDTAGALMALIVLTDLADADTPDDSAATRLVLERMNEDGVEEIGPLVERLNAARLAIASGAFVPSGEAGRGDMGLREPPTPKVGRNDPCPCGSGKKFKKCCLH